MVRNVLTISAAAQKKKNKYTPKLKRFNVCTYMQNIKKKNMQL
jgi:hypothetical protein